ncbi:MAG TPA: hypothetical protein VGV88_10940 [Candidatus Dormibacteraeota bacterium]|nr:hypothetical protein [Candidatus Dormibacteraeota bacterium]
MQINASRVIRWSGLAAFVAGIIFAGIQPIHPADAVASVNTTAWAVITSLKTVMCLLFLAGITGLYGRQVDKAGWLGLAGFVLLGISWALQTAFVFAEAFILPSLATLAPTFVDGVLRSLTSGEASAANLGALPAIYTLVGVTYILGGLVFGVATFRAGILSRWAAGLLAVAAALTPVTVVLPHPVARLAAVPTAVALAWLGFSLWSERRVQAAAPSARTPHLAGLWRSLLESAL